MEKGNRQMRRGKQAIEEGSIKKEGNGRLKTGRQKIVNRKLITGLFSKRISIQNILECLKQRGYLCVRILYIVSYLPYSV